MLKLMKKTPKMKKEELLETFKMESLVLLTRLPEVQPMVMKRKVQMMQIQMVMKILMQIQMVMKILMQIQMEMKILMKVKILMEMKILKKVKIKTMKEQTKRQEHHN